MQCVKEKGNGGFTVLRGDPSLSGECLARGENGYGEPGPLRYPDIILRER